MNPRSILLLTRNVRFQTLLSKALCGGGAIVRVVRNVGEALRVICERAPLNLAVIDFDDDCHGMTLLSALNVCQPDLPIIAVTWSDAYHGAAIAYANDAAVCLTKRISAAELRMVIEKLGEPKLQLAFA